VVAAAAALVLAGCSAGPPPGTEAAPPQDTSLPSPNLETGFMRIVSGAGDSVGSIPGSTGARYAFRFKQTEPASDRFTFQDRELSFYFRPTPEALHFQIENRTDRPVWIDWDRSSFMSPNGSSGQIAHAATRWQDRYGTQPPTQIVGLQRYSDYAFPADYLVDPAGDERQLHRTLLPEDDTALHYVDRAFGVNLTFRIDDRLIPYTFRFKVASVVPR
jgi:hypothetical protein